MGTKKFVSADCGVGKTHAILKRIRMGVAAGERFILCQPSTALLDRSCADLIKQHNVSEKLVTCIHSKNIDADTTVAKEVWRVMEEQQPSVLLITHEALLKMEVEFVPRVENYHLILDEVINPYRFGSKRLPLCHDMVTQYIKLVDYLPDWIQDDYRADYAQIQVNDMDAVRNILRNPLKDDVYACFKEVLEGVASNKFISLVHRETYERLLQGPESKEARDADHESLTIFSVLEPWFLDHFKSFLVVTAHFQDTHLASIFQIQGFEIEEDTTLKRDFRTQGHAVENRFLHVCLGDGKRRFSKYFRDSRSVEGHTMFEHILDQIETLLKQAEIDLGKVLFLINKDVQDQVRHRFAVQDERLILDHNMHGQNDPIYQMADAIVILDHSNPTPRVAPFFAAIGVDCDAYRLGQSCQIGYQAALRTALRDPNSDKPVVVIHADTLLGETLEEYLGVAPDRLPLPDLANATTVGRPTKQGALTSTERSRLHRAKKKMLDMDATKTPKSTLLGDSVAHCVHQTPTYQDRFHQLVLARSYRLSSGGWHNIDCPCCGDTRGRLGLMFNSEGGLVAKCFNAGCALTTAVGWTPGQGLRGALSDLYKRLGGFPLTEAELKRAQRARKKLALASSAQKLRTIDPATIDQVRDRARLLLPNQVGPKPVDLPITFFSSVLDNEGISGRFSWAEISADLEAESHRTLGKKEDAQLLSPAHFRGTRSKHNVERAGFLVLDVDEGATIDQAVAVLTEFGLESLVWTTASHTPDRHKFRVVVPLTREVDQDTYVRCWPSLNLLLGGVADNSKVGAESMFYLPAQYAGRDNQFHHVRGSFVGPEFWGSLALDE